MKSYLLLTILSACALFSPTPSVQGNEPDPVIFGILKQGESEDGESYLFVEVLKSVFATTDNGEAVESNKLQLAGLSPGAWEEAFGLLDSQVRISGKPMPAMTVHHHTPVLWVCDKVNTADSEPKK